MTIGKLRYCIFDPTGNITALVESGVAVKDQPEVAAGVMDLHPEVEQVGFVSFADEAAAAEGCPPVSLRMAGGEFCGNATMCAAALYAIRSGLQSSTEVCVKVSGAGEPLKVSLERTGGDVFAAAVTMPPAKSIDELKLSNGMLTDESALCLPVVRMGGIDHIIIEPDSGFLGLKDNKELAESLIRGWCSAIGADCLGMMFLGEGWDLRTLTPLVYVPGADTMFWENSCASGSAAAGMYLAAESGTSVDVTFEEPAGKLRVCSDPAAGQTVLHGAARLVSEH